MTKWKPNEMMLPDDWETFYNVTDDGLVMICEEFGGGLWIVTGDDPDGTGDLLYRLWFVSEDVEELPSKEIREVVFEGVEPSYSECVMTISKFLEKANGEQGDATEDDLVSPQPPSIPFTPKSAPPEGVMIVEPTAEAIAEALGITGKSKG
ncbi:hypothetical protein UFOVP1279_58 [uncultured Caudovirales phage]|uniref:Uncharacterized protein n=1 Tax=uncultured Caudovirales phage TaxID=2100421 RepID=A0A6J5RLI9_9CAUD|nr:hypothetical protein UFOVP1279_58 [uncultured Caudovirales phage]